MIHLLSPPLSGGRTFDNKKGRLFHCALQQINRPYLILGTKKVQLI